MERAVIHLNVADFAVAVERLVDRRLQDRPVVVAPRGGARATVYDMSEEAYRSGVRKGMGLHRAQRVCRDIRVLPLHRARYEQAMRALVRLARPYSPLIEIARGDGHLFVEVTGTRRLWGPARDVALRLHRDVKSDLRLDPVWSVAPNKLVAKAATRLVKPSGDLVVPAGSEQTFLAPLPLNLLPGLARVDLQRLRDLNLQRVHQAAALTPAQLAVAIGRRADGVYQALRGIDAAPVLPVDHRPPVVRRDHAFGEDANDVPTVEAALYRLVEQTGGRLRRRSLAAGRIAIAIDHSDGLRRVRQSALRPATANDLALYASARSVLRRAWTRRVRIRHLTLICDRLSAPPAQRLLFDDERRNDERRTAVVAVVDRIRQRFGPHALAMGRTLAAG